MADYLKLVHFNKVKAKVKLICSYKGNYSHKAIFNNNRNKINLIKRIPAN